ncbi:MAG: pyrimidine/purine nucleoside phosphorylase [Akkermansiaceae bacterium]|nr:pyrimidine/purine nucleoside phosphorylase [Akkermansiaceae bacterium]
MTFENATVEAKANIYFDGKVVSHTVVTDASERKTVGLIYPGSYHFGTQAPELMEIISGNCEVTLDGTEETFEVVAGSDFNVPGNSGFTIKVKDCICEYICTFLKD